MDLQAVARAEMAQASVEALSRQKPFKTPSGVAALRRGVNPLSLSDGSLSLDARCTQLPRPYILKPATLAGEAAREAQGEGRRKQDTLHPRRQTPNPRS